MVSVNVTDRAGKKVVLQAKPGTTLMEILRDNNLGVEAICGGCCSCATCHVFIPTSWKAKLPVRSDDENDLLVATASYRPEESRLSCQVTLNDALDGIEVTVAAPD